MKANKIPLAEKAIEKKAVITEEWNELQRSVLEIDAAVKKELDAKGLVGRWVNATDLKRRGFNKAGWRAYKTDLFKGGSGESFNGIDPNGYIVRADLILAVKTKAEVARHRAVLAQKAAIMGGYARAKAKEIGEMAREAGVKTATTDRYYEEGESREEDDAD